MMFKQQRLGKAISTASFRNAISIIFLLILISGVVIGACAWSAPTGGAVREGATQSGSAAETVSVVLGPHAFTPAAVTRTPGPFRLEVANQSGAQEITLQIRRDSGGSVVQEWRVQGGAQTWSAMVELEPGGYDLTVAENPACLFHIAVQ
jgi:hypothetical protein